MSGNDIRELAIRIWCELTGKTYPRDGSELDEVLIIARGIQEALESERTVK